MGGAVEDDHLFRLGNLLPRFADFGEAETFGVGVIAGDDEQLGNLEFLGLRTRTAGEQDHAIDLAGARLNGGVGSGESAETAADYRY